MAIDERTLAVLAEISQHCDFIEKEIMLGVSTDFNTGRLKAYKHIFDKYYEVFGEDSDILFEKIKGYRAFQALKSIAPSIPDDWSYRIIAKKQIITDIVEEHETKKK